MSKSIAKKQPIYLTDSRIDTDCKQATEKYLSVSKLLKDRSFWGIRMTTALNIFYWHLDAFGRDEDPRPGFINLFQSSANLFKTVASNELCQHQFPPIDLAKNEQLKFNVEQFEAQISGLFSDVWVNLTDEIYFDQSYEFTKERLEKNNVNPFELFRDKIVVDCGCGSGKYSATIARFGAKKVIGIDIGEKGLEFARQQAEKVSYGNQLDYRYGSLLDIPLDTESVDMVWSNGVIHHTADYEKCLSEFSRVLKKGGDLFLYVDGPSGLFELMCDTFVDAHKDLPRQLFQHYLGLLGIDSGRIYWIMDCLYAPYERKTKEELEALLQRYNFTELKHLPRGIDIDNNEMVARQIPYAEVKYGNGMLKYLAKKAI